MNPVFSYVKGNKKLELCPPVFCGASPNPSTGQVQALRHVLSSAASPQDVEGIAARFKGAQRARVSEVLETLAALGQVRRIDAGLVLAV